MNAFMRRLMWPELHLCSRCRISSVMVRCIDDLRGWRRCVSEDDEDSKTDVTEDLGGVGDMAVRVEG